MKTAQIVQIDGLTLGLTQDAYISDSGKTFEASAVDGEGNEYQVYWNIIWDAEEGLETCDWRKPVEAIRI